MPGFCFSNSAIALSKKAMLGGSVSLWRNRTTCCSWASAGAAIAQESAAVMQARDVGRRNNIVLRPPDLLFFCLEPVARNERRRTILFRAHAIGRASCRERVCQYG